MQVIDIIDEDHYLNESHYQLIDEILDIASKKIGLEDNYELDITIVNNEKIHELNKEYRGIDRPTDVLSFALEETNEEDDFPIDISNFQHFYRHLGDIVISNDKIIEQAETYNHSFERELGFLVVHGFLHVNGYDHQTEVEEKEMFAIQEEVLKEYGLTR